MECPRTGNVAYVRPEQKKADARKFAEVFEASKYKYDDAKFQKAFGGGGASSNNSSSSSQSSDDDDGDYDEEDSDNEAMITIAVQAVHQVTLATRDSKRQ